MSSESFPMLLFPTFALNAMPNNPFPFSYPAHFHTPTFVEMADPGRAALSAPAQPRWRSLLCTARATFKCLLIEGNRQIGNHYFGDISPSATLWPQNLFRRNVVYFKLNSVIIFIFETRFYMLTVSHLLLCMLQYYTALREPHPLQKAKHIFSDFKWKCLVKMKSQSEREDF